MEVKPVMSSRGIVEEVFPVKTPAGDEEQVVGSTASSLKEKPGRQVGLDLGSG